MGKPLPWGLSAFHSTPNPSSIHLIITVLSPISVKKGVVNMEVFKLTAIFVSRRMRVDKCVFVISQRGQDVKSVQSDRSFITD